MATLTKERKFFNALRDVFVGAKVEGQSGFINLMRIKSRYYEQGVFPQLQKDINESLKPFPGFRDELFERLYDFFHRYFSESGSIYFRYTPLYQNVYEKVYTDDKDVMLFWKTHMLYYVKTDRLFKSMEVEVDGRKFFFDVSKLEHKKANEKRELVYAFREKRKDGALAFEAAYSERGRRTSVDDILRSLRGLRVTLNEESLERAFQVFEKQSEVDYFINKDAKAFLEEQFNLWLYQYVFSGVSEWTETRVKQLQVLRSITFKVVAFISQFEDELVKIWNKPKFVLNSNYIITLDRIVEKEGGIAVLEKLLKHKNFKAQVEEWQQLGIVDGSFKKTALFKEDLTGTYLAKLYRHLPLDTKHFKDHELDILNLFVNLDQDLNGWLIRSENYQALNTILLKFREKAKCIYIDPPYNTGSDEFIYNDKFQHASWLSMMANRLAMAKECLNDSGAIAISIDNNELENLLKLMDSIFGRENRRNIITVKRASVTGPKVINPGVVNVTEFLILYSKNKSSWKPNKVYRARERDERYSTFIKNRDSHPRKWVFIPLLQAFAEFKGIPPRKLKLSLGENYTREIDAFVLKNATAVVQIVPLDETKRSKEAIDLKKKSEAEAKKIFVLKRDDYDDLYLIGGKRILFYSDRLVTIGSEVVQGELLTDIWDDTLPNDLHNEGGVELKKGKKPEKLIGRVIELTTKTDDLIIDFFIGSGTAAASAQKLGRKWVGVDLSEMVDEKAEPRLKNCLSGEPSGISSTTGWHGGGFFRSLGLEQYQDALKKTNYRDADLFDDPGKDPYHQYVFLRDLKMLEAMKIDSKKNEVRVDLSKLYNDIDIAETLSNLTGKWIKKITADSVEFDDGEVVDIKNLDWKRIKPLIWW